MKTVAIFPVTFARVDMWGAGYVPMNMSEFCWSHAFHTALIATAATANLKFEENSC